jgi:hypothetical protein
MLAFAHNAQMFGVLGAQRFRILRFKENSADAAYSSHRARIIRSSLRWDNLGS